MLERWPHVRRVKITFTSLPMNCFVSTRTNSMKCLVNWIPLRIRVRSENTSSHLTPVAGLIFLLEKVSDSPNFFLGILLSEFHFTVFFPGAVEWIHKSCNTIFSQPICLISIWTALFQKETVKERPPRLTRTKIPRIRKKIRWKELCPVHEITGFTLTLLVKIQELRILRKSFKSRHFFLEQI